MTLGTDPTTSDDNVPWPAVEAPVASPGGAAPASRVVGLLFADLVGSTGLKDKFQFEIYRPLLERHDALLRQAVGSVSNGRVQQDTGDGCFAVFSTASEAVRAALAFQWLMNREPWPADAKLSARVGVHVGEVAETFVRQEGGNKLVGIAVDLAARLASLAQANQILLTRGPFDDARQFVSGHPVDPKARLRWKSHGRYRLKGADEPVDVYEVGVAGVSPLTAPSASEKAKQAEGWRPVAGQVLPNSPTWVVERKLGEGGFGEVWLARHAKTRAERVFKFCFDPDRLEALKREVVLFRLLQGALGERMDIARVIDWQFDDAPYFIEMEYTPDGNLTDWAKRQGGIARVPLPRRVEIVAQVSRALAAAHSVGVLHKDIKPSNILMVRNPDGTFHPRLADFGIGELTDAARLKDFNITAAGFSSGSKLSGSETVGAGTQMYAPPESLRGRAHTVQGDVYALGVLLFQMTIGDLTRPLGVGWERDVDDDLLREDIGVCIDGDPTRRLSSAADLADRLERLDARRAERNKRANEEQAIRTAKQRRTLLRVLGVAIVALTLIAGGAAVLLSEASAQRTKALAQERRANEERLRANREAAERQAQAAAARMALANARVDSGWNAFDRGDPTTALLWFTEAIHATRETPTSSSDPQAADLQPNPDAVANRLRAALLVDGVVPRLSDVPPNVAAVDLAGGATTAAASADTTNGTRALRLSPSGGGAAVDVIDIRTGAPLGPPLKQDERITRYGFSPDGSRVVTISVDGAATLWDISEDSADPKKLQSRALVSLPRSAGVRHAAFTVDSARVVLAGVDRLARVYNAESGRLIARLRHAAAVVQAAFNPDGDWLVTTSDDRTARVWEVAGGGRQAFLLHHPEPVSAAWFVAGGSAVAVRGGGGTRTWTWDLPIIGPAPISLHAAGSPVTHRGPVYCVEFSSDGRRVVTCGGDNIVRVWDAATGRPLSLPMVHADRVGVVAFVQDGKRVMTASDDGGVRLWDVETGKLVAETKAEKHAGPIRAAVVSPDGTKIATASADKTAQVWDAQTLSKIGDRLRHDDPVNTVAFSPDSSQVVTASEDRTARVFNIASGQAVMALTHGAEVRAALFTGDQSVVTASQSIAQLWDVKSGRSIGPPMEHNDRVLALAINRKSNRLATASVDNTARIWDATSGFPLTPPMRHQHQIRHVAFSRDGSRLATSSVDMTARVWDAFSGRALTAPLRHEAPVAMSAFSPDGLWLATAGDDRTACVWPASAATATTAAFGLPSFLPDADVRLLAELLACRRVDAVGGLVGLTAPEWQKRYNELLMRYPERFLPPPTKAALDAELSRVPADPARLKAAGEWFYRRGESASAGELLDRARRSGGMVDQALIARAFWLGGRPTLAETLFERAAAEETTASAQAYLRQCAAAVKQEVAGATTQPSTSRPTTRP